MPIMFCYFDPFTITQCVLSITADNSTQLCSGTMQEVCDLMAAYYATGNYSQIVLKGTLAKSAADQIRTYAKTNYNLNEIKIEVLD